MKVNSSRFAVQETWFESWINAICITWLESCLKILVFCLLDSNNHWCLTWIIRLFLHYFCVFSPAHINVFYLYYFQKHRETFSQQIHFLLKHQSSFWGWKVSTKKEHEFIVRNSLGTNILIEFVLQENMFCNFESECPKRKNNILLQRFGSFLVQLCSRIQIQVCSWWNLSICYWNIAW